MELEQKLKKVQFRIEGILESMRSAMFVPPTSSPLRLNAEKVASYAEELVEVQAEGIKIENAIDTLKEELGV